MPAFWCMNAGIISRVRVSWICFRIPRTLNPWRFLTVTPKENGPFPGRMFFESLKASLAGQEEFHFNACNLDNIVIFQAGGLSADIFAVDHWGLIAATAFHM